MKQKVVLKVPLNSEKMKSKAMKTAVCACGVTSVTIGKENDQLVVIGEGMDPVCLAQSLRKKFCFADIVSVEEVKPPKPPAPKPPCYPDPPPCNYQRICPPLYYECAVYEQNPPSCSIM